MRPRNTSGINAVIGIDKPCGMTSHDVVARVRRILGERGVGHAGTLDPLASGVMVVGIGRATRLLGLASAEEKSYLARFSFGTETTTDDLEGEVRREAPVPAQFADPAWAAGQMGVLLSMTSQVPPAYSAISVNGVRAYKAARAGEEMELAARPIRVLEATLVFAGTDEVGSVSWDVAVRVSKGTYVRALARDLGRALGSAAHVSALRRTSSGSVGIGQCVTLEELERIVSAGKPLPALDPVRVCGLPSVELTDEEARGVRDGRRLRANGRGAGLDADADVALVCSGALHAVGRVQRGVIVPKTVFPEGIAGVTEGAKR